MAETVGLLVLSATGLGGVSGIAGFGTLATTTVAGISAATIIGSATILGVSIGLQYALNNPTVPRPENGAVPLKQGIVPRQRGYWINRLAGPYLLFIAPGGLDSQDVIAFHSGRIQEAISIYLHDDLVAVTPALGDQVQCSISSIGAFQYKFCSVQVFYGTAGQIVGSPGNIVNASTSSGEWTADYKCSGMAVAALDCPAPNDPSDFTKRFPKGLPLLSVVAKCAPVWDPRDGAQSVSNPLTWTASANPVLQLIDYLTLADGGMGEDIDTILPADALAQWVEEADLCEGRYESAGFYQFDNSPENVINKILSTCDGWLSESGDGTLALTVGVYREPSEPPITESHILGFSVKMGSADEETINQLDVTFTNPAAGYVSDQIDSVRDEDSISLTGAVRAKPLDLSWVQNSGQAQLLSQRALLRLNPTMSGTLTTTLYGQRYLGKRWVKVQFPSPAPSELFDCVVEIQDRAEVDILGGAVTFNWNLVDDEALTLLDQPILYREDSTPFYRREDDTLYVRES